MGCHTWDIKSKEKQRRKICPLKKSRFSIVFAKKSFRWLKIFGGLKFQTRLNTMLLMQLTKKEKDPANGFVENERQS